MLDADGVVVGGQPLALTMEGPPGVTLGVQLVCNLWGSNTVASPLLNVTTRAYTVALRDGTSGNTVVRTGWPSGAQVVLPWVPAVEVTAPARSVLTCSASIVDFTRDTGLGMSDMTVQVVGDTSVSVVLDAVATRANVSVPRVGLRAAGGSNATLAVSCRDGVGRSAVLGVPINVSVATVAAGWDDAMVAAMPTVVVPSQVLPALVLTVTSTPTVPLPPGTDVSSLVTCVAGLFAASTLLPLATALASAVASAAPFASAATGAGATIVTGAGNTTIVVTLPPLSTSTCPLSAALVVAAECTWMPTGERMRLQPLSLAVASVGVALTQATTLLVEAYESAIVAGAAALSPPDVATFAGADARCTWRTIAATSSSTVLAATSSAASWALDVDGAVVGSQPLALTVEGPPGATLTLQLVCSLWGGNTVVSPPLNATTRAYTVALRDGASDAAVVRAVWPSGTSMVLPWAPALDVTAPARSVLTCSVSAASAVLPPATIPLPGVGLGLSDTTLQLVGETSVSVSLDATATRANVSIPRVGLRAAGGANASLVLTCRDGVGRSAALGVPINVTVATLTAAWTDATLSAMPSVVVPSQALPALTLMVASLPAVLLPPDVDAASLLSCVAGIFRASTPLPLATPLATLIASTSSFASFSTSTTGGASFMTGADNASVLVTLPPLSTAICPLDTQLAVAVECTWTPTGERIRLPALETSTLQLALAWEAPPTIMLGYAPLPLGLTATIGASATVSSGATTTATCQMLLVNTTVRSARLIADGWSVALDGSASGGTSTPTSVNVTLQAPQVTQLYVQASCAVWGQVLTTPPLCLTTASLEARIVSALPSTFIASDASSPWPVEPPLVVAVVTRHDDALVADITCSVSASTPATNLVIVDATTALTSLRSIPTDEHNGTVIVPQFVVQTSPATRSVSLVVECQHVASGEAVEPLSLTIPATLLTAQQCVPPATKAAVGDPLQAFSVGVAVTPPGGVSTSPCTSDTRPNHLPPIVCTIALNASATTISDPSSVFLQHTAVVVSADSHVATFEDFTLVVPQGQTYGLTLTCAVGGLAIPPPLAFAVVIDGCRAGQASVSITCVTCGSGEFSLGGMGAVCIGCPPAGVTCVSGILTLLPHYFRPPSQANSPLGPDTELHPCYNSEACTLEYNATNASTGTGSNASVAIYGCAYGYTGPLCGVCDAAVNYAQFGEACALCWDAGASWLFLLVVLTLVVGVLTRVALRKDTSRSDASIVLRITLGYLQAVGSLRVFRAGSTKAYDNVMGWTEVVSASPLSVGALQCIMWLPYLFEFVATVALPLLASIAVVMIFHAAITGRSLRCKPRCGFDSVAFRQAVTSWWASKRHLSTLLFVLFLAYMPIVSASLRALDCIEPVAGRRYLRSDLRVECGVGQHAVARILAFAVLVVLGVGYPVGLAWLLGTARNEQLADAGFRATWGFLFDGYRAPKRTLATPPLPATLVTGVLADGKPATMQPTSSVGARSGRRRSSVMSDRLAQTWVVSGESRVWWEAIVHCRKAGVVLLAVTLTNPYLQCVGATLWFLGALLLQLHYSPYTKPLFNWLETASLVTTLLTAVFSTALLQFNVSVTTAELHAPGEMTSIEWAVTLLLAVMNVGTFIVLAGLWLRAQCARARGIVRRASLVSAGSGRVAGMRASITRRRSSASAAAAFSPLPSPPPAGGSIAVAGGTGTGTGTGTGKDSGVDMCQAATKNPLHARGVPAGPLVPARRSIGARTAVLAVADGSTEGADASSAAASRRHVSGGGNEDAGAAAAVLPGGASPVSPPRPVISSTPASSASAPSATTPAAATAESLSRAMAFAATPIGRSRRR